MSLLDPNATPIVAASMAGAVVDTVADVESLFPGRLCGHDGDFLLGTLGGMHIRDALLARQITGLDITVARNQQSPRRRMGGRSFPVCSITCMMRA